MMFYKTGLLSPYWFMFFVATSLTQSVTLSSFMIFFCVHFLKNFFSIGNLPQLTSMVESKGSGLNIQISTTTQGVSGKGKAHLEIDGVFSPAIANDATASEVK